MLWRNNNININLANERAPFRGSAWKMCEKDETNSWCDTAWKILNWRSHNVFLSGVFLGVPRFTMVHDVFFFRLSYTFNLSGKGFLYSFSFRYAWFIVLFYCIEMSSSGSCSGNVKRRTKITVWRILKDSERLYAYSF